MNENKLMQQVSTIFGAFMVFFYLSVGIYLIFFFKSPLVNSALIRLFGGAFILIGLYRAYTSYVNIAKLFFKRDASDE
jgi:hypothetical protein